MNASHRFGPKQKPAPIRELLQVKISHPGHADYLAAWPEHTKLGKLRTEALRHFEIGGAMGEKYVLEYRGGTCRNSQTLADLGGRKLFFTLFVKQESGRFGEALFLR